MISKSDVELVEKLIGQLQGAYSELSGLSKKSPNDAVNGFKLKFVNTIFQECNRFLSKKPLMEFEQFNIDDVPSNSDVTFVIAQYMEAIERFRADNVVYKYGSWHYNISEDEGLVRTSVPAKLKK